MQSNNKKKRNLEKNRIFLFPAAEKSSIVGKFSRVRVKQNEEKKPKLSEKMNKSK